MLVMNVAGLPRCSWKRAFGLDLVPLHKKGTP